MYIYILMYVYRHTFNIKMLFSQLSILSVTLLVNKRPFTVQFGGTQKIYGDFGTVKYECSRDEYLVGAYDKRNGVEKIFVVSEISKGFYDGLDIIIFDKYGMIESRSQKYSSVVTGPNWREELLQLFAEEQGYMNLFPLSGLSFMK